MTAKATMSKGPHPVDAHVGGRVRRLRKDLGLSQQGLAEQIGITFQQLQKYERGTNRISASKLYEICGVLGCDITFLFDGLPPSGGPSPASPAPPADAKDIVASHPQIAILVQTLVQIPETLQEQICSLVESIARAATGQDAGFSARAFQPIGRRRPVRT